MNQCNACSILALRPLRAEIPPHLQRVLTRDIPFGFVKLTAYECIHCASLWHWRVGDGWECVDHAVMPPTLRPAASALNPRYA